MRHPTTKSEGVLLLGFALVLAAFALDCLHGGGAAPLIYLPALGCLYLSRALEREDGVDASKLAYSKSERARRRLWRSIATAGLASTLASAALWIFLPLQVGRRAIKPVQWEEIGLAFTTGALLLRVSDRCLIALARAAAERESRNFTS